MVRDILRFNRESVRDLDQGRIDAGMTLGAYLRQCGYGRAFIDYYLVPMGSAIWSADVPVMLEFPLQFFVRFFRNHGLLNVRHRPQWRVIDGGSREYVKVLCSELGRRLRTATPVRRVRRLEQGVELALADGCSEGFDAVVFACHSDQALALLDDPSPAEREVLGAIPYQPNDVVLHTDTRLLPRNRRTWSSWNYLRRSGQPRPTLTYNMNILQSLTAPETLCVTLNSTDEINPLKVLGRFRYDHPVFTLEGMRAQRRWEEINGGRTWSCGAYWRNGFHEDGVVSALRVASALGSGQSAVRGSPRAGMAVSAA
jgi:predicted NAD/FAD-binding protein